MTEPLPTRLETLPQSPPHSDATPPTTAQFWVDALHALAQPVQALALFSDHLRRLPVGAQASPVVEQVKASVQDLQGLLCSLVQVAQADAGYLEVRPEAVSVDALCVRLRRHTDLMPQANSLRWRSQGQLVLADPVLLERLALVLIDLALAQAQGAGVLLAWRNLQGQGAVRLEVWWFGSHMSEHEQSQFFVPFGRSPAQSCSVQGRLALHTAQRLAQLLGSCVEVRSRLEWLVCLSLRLPISASDAL